MLAPAPRLEDGAEPLMILLFRPLVEVGICVLAPVVCGVRRREVSTSGNLVVFGLVEAGGVGPPLLLSRGR